MTQIVGIRDGHRVTITVTGHAGTAVITREHHPECPCRTPPPPAASPCGHCHSADGHHVQCPHF